MKKVKPSPHLKGIFERSFSVAQKSGYSYVDENILFFCFVANLGLSCQRVFESSGIDTKKIWESSGLVIKQRKNKFNHGFNKKAQSIIDTAEFIAVNQFNLDYVSTDSLLLSFLCPDFFPKVLKDYLNISEKENILENNIVLSLISRVSALILDQEHLLEEDLSDDSQLEKEEKKIELELPMFEKNVILSRFAQNLNILAANGECDKIIDFDNKIDELATILCRKKKPNAIIVGKEGTGKTSLVAGLAHRIVSGDAPDLLSNKVIYSVNLSSMVAGTQYRGQFEERLEQFINEAKKYSNLILFIDEIHTLVGAGGGTSSSLEASNILKPELASGTISCIGATTINEYTQSIKKDAALDRRFEKVLVRQPSKFKMKELLPLFLEYYEAFHRVKYSDEFVNNVIDFCERYLPNRSYPDKAIDVIDHCGAQAKVKFWEIDSNIKDLRKNLINKLSNEQDVLQEEVEEFSSIISSWEERVTSTIPEVTLDHLKQFFATKGNKLNDLNVIKEVEKEVLDDFYGNKKEIGLIFNSVKKSALGLSPKERHSSPDVFLIHGPTNSGKSLFASLLADAIEKIGAPVLKYNGVHFSDYYAKHKIVSSHESNASLAEKVLISPNSIIIIDDFDKIDGSCNSLLSQMIKEGILQMPNGDIVDFSNTKIFLFSNQKKSTREMGFNTINSNSSVSSDIPKLISDIIKNQFELKILNKRGLRRVIYEKCKRIKESSLIHGFNFDFNFKFIKEFVDKNYTENNPVSSLLEAFDKEVVDHIKT